MTGLFSVEVPRAEREAASTELALRAIAVLEEVPFLDKHVFVVSLDAAQLNALKLARPAWLRQLSRTGVASC